VFNEQAELLPYFGQLDSLRCRGVWPNVRVPQLGRQGPRSGGALKAPVRGSAPHPCDFHPNFGGSRSYPRRDSIRGSNPGCVAQPRQAMYAKATERSTGNNRRCLMGVRTDFAPVNFLFGSFSFAVMRIKIRLVNKIWRDACFLALEGVALNNLQ
jgi:hypothetical protein